MNTREISVGLVSHDPFFLFAARALLGRDRRARIYDTVETLDAIPPMLAGLAGPVHAVVVDVDSLRGDGALTGRLADLISNYGEWRFSCITEGSLAMVVPALEDTPVRALVSRRDLGYSLHLLIRAAAEYEVQLVGADIRRCLTPGSALSEAGRTLLPERPHPALSPRVEEIMRWRIFIGLDNPDIQDELALGGDTIREHVSHGYKGLGAKNELEAFEALSAWWWMTRFAPLLG